MNNKGKMNTGKKVARTAGLAVAFGALAGAMMFGVYTLGNTFTAGVLETADNRAASSGIEAVDTMNSLTSVDLGKGLLQEAGAVSTDLSDMSDTAESLGSVEAVVKECMPSVVTIGTVSVQEMRNIFGGAQQYEAQGAGTGVIVAANDTELLIATNNHVVEGAQSLSVGFIDESSYEATIKGTDAQNDLAVIAVKLDDISEETMSQIKIAKIGSSDDLSLGEQVVAIGNALGEGQSVTTGIISALGRELQLTDGKNTFVSSGLIQTDASINPGNSGGALLNMKGELIGINEAKASYASLMPISSFSCRSFS